MKIKSILKRNTEYGIHINNNQVKIPERVPILYNHEPIGFAKVTLEDGEFVIEGQISAVQVGILEKAETCVSYENIKEKAEKGMVGFFPSFTIKDVEETNTGKVANDVSLIEVSLQFKPLPLNNDGTIDLNEFAREITKKEAGKKEVDIAQTKQIAKEIARILLDVRNSYGQEKMIETIERLAE